MSGGRCGVASSDVVVPICRTERADGTRPFVVEFVGTPGSGKTTLALRLVAILRRHGVAADTVVGGARDHIARTRAGRVIRVVPGARMRSLLQWWAFYAFATARAIRFAAAHRALTREVIASQVARRLPLRRRVHVLYWFFQLCGRYDLLFVTSRRGEVLVVDDGFLHRAVTLHASHAERPTAESVQRYLDLVPPPDVAVLTIAPSDVCRDRVLARGVWRHSRKLTAPEIGRALSNAELAADLAVAYARRRGWIVVGVENGGRTFDRVESDLSRVVAHCLAGVAPRECGGSGT